MIRLAMILVIPALLRAQSPLVKRGAGIFSATCVGAYCHGPEGSAGRAPQLAGRAWIARNVFGVVLNGRAGAGMPGFLQQLKSEDIEAVTQYVVSLSSPPKSPDLPPAAEKGAALFFDAQRMSGCGKCHELDNRGSAVGPDLSALAPAQFRNLRATSGARVVTAKAVDEDPFPGIVAEQTPEHIRVYDLASPLPVLRTYRPAQVRLTQGTWSHAAVVQIYSDTELESITSYLTWLVRTQSTK